MPVRYTTAATMARSILDREILRHIDSSLTVKGMKSNYSGLDEKEFLKALLLLAPTTTLKLYSLLSGAYVAQ